MMIKAMPTTDNSRNLIFLKSSSMRLSILPRTGRFPESPPASFLFAPPRLFFDFSPRFSRLSRLSRFSAARLFLSSDTAVLVSGISDISGIYDTSSFARQNQRVWER
ncbi:MAG TPA: hypothetical protein IAC57_00195 [Candidatus Scatosoma pullistercoris]|uniref:Uncharacterized protein n=1 Tax=Candidatus Scatosoma pullistercoris TaxID=2840934 RepID=A0A9D1ME09_9FIRM|nr:hypothetical protein [Candidatus Scatosoma pullistercoris]